MHFNSSRKVNFKKIFILSLLSLSLSSIIGVGFLSGAEIWVFFASFGENFVFSIVIVFVLLFVFCYKIM